MAITHFVNNKKAQTAAGLKALMLYTAKLQKTLFEGAQLVSGIGCSAHGAFEDFKNTKLLHGKTDGRLYYHFVQSFSPDEKVDPKVAHEAARRLAETFDGFEALVCTYTDRDHIHSHLIINSVNFENRKKFHVGSDELKDIRRNSDAIIKELGLEVYQPAPKSTSAALGEKEIRPALRGESWKFTLIKAIDDALKRSGTKEEFIANMEYEGISVSWSDSRKYITYEMPDGKRCSDIKLHDEQYLKENMEKLFSYRSEFGFTPFADEPSGGWLSVCAPTPEGIIRDALRLGKDIESISDVPKQKANITFTDSKTKKRERIKMLAQGHKLRDELEQEMDY